MCTEKLLSANRAREFTAPVGTNERVFTHLCIAAIRLNLKRSIEVITVFFANANVDTAGILFLDRNFAKFNNNNTVLLNPEYIRIITL